MVHGWCFDFALTICAYNIKLFVKKRLLTDLTGVVNISSYTRISKWYGVLIWTSTALPEFLLLSAVLVMYELFDKKKQRKSCMS